MSSMTDLTKSEAEQVALSLFVGDGLKRFGFAHEQHLSGCIKGKTSIACAPGKRGEVPNRNVLRAFDFLPNAAKPFAFITQTTNPPVVGQSPTSVCTRALQTNRPSPDSPALLTADIVNGLSAAPGLMNKLKVLITDDSRTLRDRLAEMLTQLEGLEIVGTAATVSEAFAAIHQHRPDVLVLDLQIGDNNGIEILRSTKVAFPRVKVIVFTNQTEPQYRERCADLGADYFLCKSTDSNVLIETLNELIERPQP
jgi:CheY-like chemotaxis protein